MVVSEEIELEIVSYSYWEHFKMAKDMALVLPLEHPKRKAIEYEMNKLTIKMKKLNDSIKLQKQNNEHKSNNN